jgi:1-deoxy-D-xylulose-5-phosphate reductoisomerase
MPKQVVVLGATGSIGCSTLDVIAQHPTEFQVLALTGGVRVDVLFQQCLSVKPRFAAVLHQKDATDLQRQLKDAGLSTQVLAGEQAFCDLAGHPDADIVMAAIVGAAGLLPTLAAVKQGKTVLLANKEALVMSGELFINAVKHHNATLLPIDSEHNAIFQCLPADLQAHSYQSDLQKAGIAKILLTGSGGPFRQKPLAEFAAITPAQAVAHPNWSMGRKISVDSATMMNKGLEFIEARWLFNCQPSDIEVVIHPQSIIHSMVQYTDGSVIAQLGNPDMRTPIAHALAFPNRISSTVKPLNFFEVPAFSFEKPDPSRYPCLYLAIEACGAGQGATTALNAANEIAVDAFLAGKIAFTSIAEINSATLSKFTHHHAAELADILAVDQAARLHAELLLRTKHV